LHQEISRSVDGLTLLLLLVWGCGNYWSGLWVSGSLLRLGCDLVASGLGVRLWAWLLVIEGWFVAVSLVVLDTGIF
jgi:hypothetical protein